ncbi:hypothetical protein D3C86_1696920 [compost metagenome]
MQGEAELDELVAAEAGDEQAVPEVVAVAGDEEDRQVVDEHRRQCAEEQALQKQHALFVTVEGCAAHQAGAEVGRAFAVHAQDQFAAFPGGQAQR